MTEIIFPVLRPPCPVQSKGEAIYGIYTASDPRFATVVFPDVFVPMLRDFLRVHTDRKSHILTGEYW